MQVATMTPVALRLAQLRNAKHWSQSELARRSGVPQSTISRLESGDTRSIDLDNLGKLAEALGVNAAYLIDHTQEAAPAPPKKGRGKR
jgi:transcriptional regulator with XRE-family HTH domain